MTLDQFKADVTDELTVSCSLPFKLPPKALDRIINKATQWFHKNFEDAVEDGYIVVQNSAFNTDQFKDDRTICLGGDIIQVFDVQESNNADSIYGSLSDFSLDKLVYGNSGIYGSTTSSTDYDSLVSYVTTQYWLDMSRHILMHPISYTFNRLTKKLRIAGQAPANGDIVLTVSKSIPSDALYSEEIFFRYVVARSKIDISRVIGTFAFPMPGNVQINYDIIRQEGIDEFREVKEEIKDDEGMDYFFITKS